MFRIIVVSVVILLPSPALAQQPAPASPATAFLDRYREILNLAPVAGQVAEVNHLVLGRDVARLTLEHGKMYLLAPLGGQTVGAVFQGDGRFSFAPPIPAEQTELRRFANAPALDDSISEVILLFTDSTAEQLKALPYRPGEIPGEIGGHARDLLESFKGDKEGSFDSDVMRALLNGAGGGYFLARVERKHGDAVLFQYDPALSEAVQLYRPVRKMSWGSNWAVVTQFPGRQTGDSSVAWRYREDLSVPAYRMDINLPLLGSGNLDFSARAELTIKAVHAVGPWLLFSLHPKLQADSARWGSGEPAAVFKAKDDDALWVRAGRPLQAGDSLSLTLYYHGDLIDRLGSWFFVDPLASWFPENGQGQTFATFDLTFHSPSYYPLASVGERVDSSLADKVLTSHWVSTTPTPYASFNLGLFKNYHTQQPGAPPLDVLLSEDAHREMQHQAMSAGVYIPQQSHMRENVAADVSNSLKFFAYLFGEAPYQHFYVTEIPYGEGVSFPGMIDLSWSTFQNTTLDGFDEWFRAHEVAHQWWGNGVHNGSYRDAWLREGLASFSALWYLQTERKRSVEYFKFLDQYRAEIAEDKDDAGPIWIGYRASSPSARRGYDIMVYEKGAWVFHMLRILMLDLSTNKEDRFTETMRDYYRSFRGRPATTLDFQRVVERHAAVPMDWFFDEWVKGTGVPTYHVAWTAQPAAGGKYQVRFRITQEHVPPDFHMFVLVSADLGENRFAHFRVGVRGDQTEYLSPLLPAEPKGITFNDLHSVLADVKMERW